MKADIHLLRVTLTLAESMLPGAGGAISCEVVDAASRIVGFTLDCWRALPEAQSMALSRRDEVLDTGVEHLADWLEQHGGTALREVLLRSQVAGVKTAADLDELLDRYEATYPGAVIKGESTGGRPPCTVFAPPRRQLASL